MFQRFVRELRLVWSNKQHRFFLYVQCLAVVVAGVMLFVIPPPGWAVAIIAILAAAMTVNEGMQPPQKAIWMIVLGMFLVVELIAITHDRSANERKALSDRAEQDSKLAQIRKQEDVEFVATIRGLNAAIQTSTDQFRQTTDWLAQNLNTEKATFEQTRPSAAIFLGLKDVDGPFDLAKPRKPFSVIVQFKNSGDTARKVLIAGHIYVATQNQTEAAKQIIPQFENWWSHLTPTENPEDLLPKDPIEHLARFTKNGFTEKEAKEMVSHTSMLYVMYRMRYTDTTGVWEEDRCAWIASVTNQEATAKDCQFFNYPHKRVKQR